eukprot:4305677-Pyramimonas_sp.AAC.1
MALANEAGVNTIAMDNTWVSAGILQHKEDDQKASGYVEKNAAYRADPRGAERLGRSYQSFTGTLE